MIRAAWDFNVSFVRGEIYKREKQDHTKTGSLLRCNIYINCVEIATRRRNVITRQGKLSCLRVVTVSVFFLHIY